MRVHRILWLSAALVACGGGGSDESGSTGPSGAYPSDSSASGITAYLASGDYRVAPWEAETAGVRNANSGVSPHGRVQVWMNDVLRDSADAGNGQVGGSAHSTGSMAVKELYDASDALLGKAVMLKLDGGAEEWVYYCDGPEGACGGASPTQPLWGIGLDTDCGFCHGGLVFNAM